MSYFEYVSKEEVSRIRNDLTAFTNLVQKDIKDLFTFTYTFIGASTNNMVTTNYYSNIGYDFDVSIIINDKNDMDPNDIIKELKSAFDKHQDLFKYNYTDDDKRVFSIKLKDKKRSKLNHVCDFGVYKTSADNQTKYISFNKKTSKYEWINNPKGIALQDHKIMWLKDNGYWQEIRERYLENRSLSVYKNKPTRLIFSDLVNSIYKESNRSEED